MSECAHDKSQVGVCTPAKIANKLSTFAGVKGSSKEIIEMVKKKTNCETESCIYKNKNVINVLGDSAVNSILKEYFKPSGPAFTTEWLSNYDIDNVLDQFEKKYPSFYHIYFQMRDFAKKKLTEAEKKNPEMLKYSLNDIEFSQKIKEGIATFGCVLNTDFSTGQGEHWFCLFGDFRKEPYQIEYFNSSGDAPLDEVQIWLDKTKHDLEKKTGKRVKLIICRTQHQHDSHSCGPYSLYYIVNRLKGVPAETFDKSIGGDKRMMRWRREMFTS